MQRKVGLKIKVPLRSKRPMKRAGKKTKEWDRVRVGLKVKFQRAGITSCEAGFEGCWHDNALSFAHSKKRRLCVTPELMEECALMCVPCHEISERLPHAEMESLILGLIAARKVPV